jgi:hypothetical protein
VRAKRTAAAKLTNTTDNKNSLSIVVVPKHRVFRLTNDVQLPNQ